MKRRIFSLVLSLAALLLTGASASAAGEIVLKTWNVDGVERKAYVYLPNGVNGDNSGAPVVFSVHGHGQAGGQANALQQNSYWTHDPAVDFLPYASGGNPYLSVNKVNELWPEAIVIWPEGLGTPGKATDPAGTGSGWQYMPNQSRDSDGTSAISGPVGDRDIAFLDAMLETVRSDYKTDADHTYFSGFSNGGGFTYVAWAMRAGEFAAFGPISTIADESIPSLTPKAAFLAGGTLDPLVTPALQELMRVAVIKVNEVTGEGEMILVDTSAPGNAGDGVGVSRLTTYDSKLGAPVQTFYYPRAHAQDTKTQELMVEFFKGIDVINTATPTPNSKEAAWAGGDGTWDNSGKNWLAADASAVSFLPFDAALFDSASGGGSIRLDGDNAYLSGLKVTGGANYSLSGAALHVSAAGAKNLPDIDYANDLVHNGTGTLLLATGDPDNHNIIAGTVSAARGTLALGDGFILDAAIEYDKGMYIGAPGGASSAVLDVRGAAALNDMPLLVGPASELRFSGPNSSLTLNSNTVMVVNGADASILLAGSAMSVDLNRAKDLAAITVVDNHATDPSDSASLALDGAILRVLHTGKAADGSWLLVDGAYSGEFAEVQGTATLNGKARYENGRILVDAAYTALSDSLAGLGSSSSGGASTLSANAQQTLKGFLDSFDRESKNNASFFTHLGQMYPSAEEFGEALVAMLPSLSAEGAIAQGAQMLAAQRGVASTALNYAFAGMASGPAPTPLAFQSPGNQPLGMGYSVLANWQPATDSARGMVAAASPEYALNLGNPNTPFGLRMWGGYLGSAGRQDDKNGSAGYDSEQNGFLLGASLDLTPNWILGFYGGRSDGETFYNGLGTTIDSGVSHVGAFARYQQALGAGTLKLTGDVLYSHAGNNSSRRVSTRLGYALMSAEFSQSTIGGGLELAYDWKLNPNTVVTPYLAGHYAHLRQDGYTEQGIMPLTVNGTSASVFGTTLGVKAARDFNLEYVILTPRAMVGWQHQWVGRHVSTTSNFVGSPASFTTRSIKQNADAALLGIGLDILIKNDTNWNLGLKFGYNAALRGDGNDQTVFAEFEIKF